MVECDFYPGFMGTAFHHMAAKLYDFSDADFFESEFILSGFDFGHVQYVADEIEQVLPAFPDTGNIFEVFFGADGAK